MHHGNPRLSLSLSGALVAAFLLAAPAYGAHNDKPEPHDATRTDVVQTSGGPVQGVEENTIRKFLGIPYAAPPVGDLRWRPPQQPKGWNETRDTTEFGNTCPQTNTLITFAAKSNTEDCLHLNVFAPADSADGKLPVMVWIHGGGLVDGESDDYDPSRLVTQGDVIVVTVNYRLNALGFFALPSLAKEDHAQANYGLMDQQFALKWVQTNIANFGGDPANVTLFGESAGGLSVLANLASPTAKGLFQRAIVESPARGQKLRLNQPTLASAEDTGVAFAKAVGCEDLTISCLRSKPIEVIQSAASSYSTSLIVDGTILEAPLGQSFDAGNFNHVPVLIGANKDEGRFSVAYKELTSGQTLTESAYLKAIESAHKDQAQAVNENYPLTDYNSPSTALAAIMTDGRIVCPVRRLDNHLAKVVPTYAYEFADRTAPFYFPAVSFVYGAAHTAELQYLFAGYHGASGEEYPLNPLQQELSKAMVGYWTSFARSGDPNSGQWPEWPRYGQDNGKFQLLKLPAPTATPGADYDATHRCEFWSREDKADAQTGDNG